MRVTKNRFVLILASGYVMTCIFSGCSRSDKAEPSGPQTKLEQEIAEQPTSHVEDKSGETTPAVSVPEDSDKLEGEWSMVSGEYRGEATPQDALSNGLLTIEGDNLTHKFVGVITLSGPFTVDVTENPKWIEVTDIDGPSAGKKMLGIYELSGDELKLCFSLPDTDRPKNFSTKEGTGNILHVWNRKR